ncbi:hypothetical protein FFLO_03333 [Filobasidium floriforme]|uniref:Uncharacterized protein n=1 Tax=Filobasidium floriforme TaxID=5210 RepID=A0A8K0NT89_9TREE|nr:hypothetical protein FFLO_03333 [Filobasidium floriforme]
MRGSRVSDWSSADQHQSAVWLPGMSDFSYKIFVHCKRIIRGEDVLSGRTSTALSAGAIRALVQQYQPFKPIGEEPAPLTWWRSRLKEDPFECWGQYRERSDFSLDVMSPYAKEVERWLLPPSFDNEIDPQRNAAPRPEPSPEAQLSAQAQSEPKALSRPEHEAEPQSKSAESGHTEISSSDQADTDAPGIPESDSAEKVDRQLGGRLGADEKKATPDALVLAKT